MIKSPEQPQPTESPRITGYDNKGKDRTGQVAQEKVVGQPYKPALFLDCVEVQEPVSIPKGQTFWFTGLLTNPMEFGLSRIDVNGDDFHWPIGKSADWQYDMMERCELTNLGHAILVNVAMNFNVTYHEVVRRGSAFGTGKAVSSAVAPITINLLGVSDTNRTFAFFFWNESHFMATVKPPTGADADPMVGPKRVRVTIPIRMPDDAGVISLSAPYQLLVLDTKQAQ